jgi:hypothetical protein
MNTVVVAGLFGVGGAVVGGALTLLSSHLQRRHDARERRADRLHDQELRVDDRQERLELHWLNTKHEVYAQYLSRMELLRDAVEECFSMVSMRPYVEDGRQKRQELPYPTQLRVEAQETLDQLWLLAPGPVVQTAFAYMVHVAHWYYYSLSYVHHTNNQGDDVPEQLATRAREATAANHEKREVLVAAIRQDLGVGALPSISADLGSKPLAEEAQP